MPSDPALASASVLPMPVPVIWRDMIDTALYTIVVEKYTECSLSAFGRCAEYAIVGARVLRLLLNLPYVAVGGDLPIPDSLQNNPPLRGRKQDWLWTDTACLRLPRKYERENEAYFAQTPSAVLHKIADQMERIIADMVQHQTESLVA